MKRKALTIISLVLVLIGCSIRNEYEGAEGDSSNVDGIIVDGSQYIRAWELALVDASGIVTIGEAGQGSPVPSGDPVFAIPGYPARGIVAVKTTGGNEGFVEPVTGYRIYVRHGEDGKTYTPAIHDRDISQIQIYKGTELLRELRGQDVASLLELFGQQGPNNEFPFESEPRYTVLLHGDDAIGRNYGITTKDGEFGLAHTESKLPAAIAPYFADHTTGVHVDWSDLTNPLIDEDIKSGLQTALLALAAKEEERFRSVFISESAADAFLFMLDHDYRFDEIGATEEDGAGRIVVEVKGEAVYKNDSMIRAVHHLYYFMKNKNGLWRLAAID
ncbi:hypothetical protein MO973_13585 [Paenibacillus sp. TRM 82003]|nr:hypothetical protein [Paenibacillus sp. TRM 82003]